ncbi:hypothetical protein GBA52_010676 [Prunus armeniaca]|nr:hypothetical protein GBA52_010676 [Prunus armeniaca]
MVRLVQTIPAVKAEANGSEQNPRDPSSLKPELDQILLEPGRGEEAKVDEIKAAMENGVLSVTVPKAEVKKPDVKAIEISC